MVAFLLAAALSFAEARARGEAGSPELRALRYAEPQAQASIEAARQLPNPTLTATFGGEDPQESISLEQRLPFLGQRQTAVSAAEQEVPIARAEIAAGSARIAAAVRRAYFGLAAAQAELSLAADTTALAIKLEAAARARLENGSASQLELEQAQVARGRAQAAQLERSAALSQARAELATLLGAPDEDLEASDLLETNQVAPPLPELLARLDSQPAIAAKRLESQLSSARASAERAQVIPVPALSLGYERGQQAPVNSIRAGIAFELPLLSWNRGRVAQEVLNAERAAAEASAEESRLNAELRAARARWEQSRARSQLAVRELVPAAEHLLSLARAAYELGRAPLLSVLAAQSDLLASRSAELEALLEVQRALADIEEAIGAPL